MKTESILRRSRSLTAGVVTLLLLAACSSGPPERPVVDVEDEKHTYANGSLWPGQSKKNMLFADNKAERIGDIVTVHVVESTTASNRANTTDNRTTSNAMTIDTGGLNPTTMNIGGGFGFRGNGVTGRSDTFSATVSCLVTELLPNGNMVIEGQRRMQINNEEQYVLVKGIIRPDDVTYNNTVLSTQIAQADIRYTGEGGMDGGREPGWASELLQSVWPF